MKLRPLNDRIVVEFIEEEEKKTESGIVLPDTAKKEKPQQGKVVAVGKGSKDEDLESVEVGDVVVFDKFAGTKVNLEDDEYIILSLEDVLAVVEQIQ
ncbi:MAG: co-chaperone GroES [Bacillota bacterium]